MAEKLQYERFWYGFGLTGSDFTIDVLPVCDEGSKDLKNFMYYLDSERAWNIAEELVSLPEDKRKNVIRNLSSIYPLSRPLVMEILRVIKSADADVLNGFDAGCEFFGSLKTLILDVEDKLRPNKLTQMVEVYKKDIKTLEKKIKEQEAKRAELKELIDKKASKENELKRLEQECDKGALQKEIEELRFEVNKKKNEIEVKKKEKEKKELLLREAEEDLKNADEAGDLQPEQTKLLQKILKKFPKDAED